jgi:hypothetical protein
MTAGQNEINKELAQQLGHRTLAMLGVKQLVSTPRGLTMKIGRNSKNINTINIELNVMDTYEIKFMRVSVRGVNLVSEFSDVHAEQMLEIIESETGLATSL